MSQHPHSYNRRMGPALVVLVMDTVRRMAPTTLPDLHRALARELGADERLRTPLYWNVKNKVKALADAGLIITERRYNQGATTVAYTITINLPPTCSE